MDINFCLNNVTPLQAELIGGQPHFFPDIPGAIEAFLTSPLYRGMHYLLKPRNEQIKSYWRVVMLIEKRLNRSGTVGQLPYLPLECWIEILKSAYVHIFSLREEGDVPVYINQIDWEILLIVSRQSC